MGTVFLWKTPIVVNLKIPNVYVFVTFNLSTITMKLSHFNALFLKNKLKNAKLWNAELTKIEYQQ
jgi:hypothetical protein